MRADVVARISGSGLRWDTVFGGMPVIGMDELMGALAGLARGPELCIRVAICGQSDMVPELQIATAVEFSEIMVKKGWKAVPGKPVMRTIANYVVAELADPKTYFCGVCGGSGKRSPTPANPSTVCPKCRGEATVSPSGRKMAAVAGIDEAAWRRTWAPRVPFARRIVNGWLQDAALHVSRQLRY